RPLMKPATSDWNLTPSSTALVSAPSTMAGVGLLGQSIVVEGGTVMLSALVPLCAPAVTWTGRLEGPAGVGGPRVRPVGAGGAGGGGGGRGGGGGGAGGASPARAGERAGRGAGRAPARRVSPVRPLTERSVAERFALPAATGGARPAAPMVAAAGFEDAHVT